MQIITADWETYYDKDYSLSKLTTEEYVNDTRFEAIMLGLRMPDGKRKVVTGTHAEIQYQLNSIDWSQYAVLCHNTMFDAAIFTWRFNVKPAVWLDTLSMARAMHGAKGNSLAALAKKYNLQDKQDVVQNMLGRTRDSLSPEEFERYAKYCLNDVSITWKLFKLLSEGWYNLGDMDNRGPYPVQELKLIDKIIRMYTEPVLRLNKDKLQSHYNDVVVRKEALLEKITTSKDDLMSNNKFAEVLLSYGVTPPMKVSPTTGKETYAFAKSDEGMKALLEHPNEDVQALATARLGVKSTLEETRTQRFIGMAERSVVFPVPLRYSAARTHRLGGSDGINLQNLPARGAQKNKLKSCIEAPPGYVIIDCDSSNIEARMLAWLAGQDDLVEDFANGVDVYCKMASKIYNRTITKADVKERFVGKTCLTGETLVLCERGWVPLVEVNSTDKVWDGVEWVSHGGLLKNGLRKVVNLSGVWLTPDHKVLCGTQWLETHQLLTDSNILGLALDTGAENLPLQVTSLENEEEYVASLSPAIVGVENTQYLRQTSKDSYQQGVYCADLNQRTRPIWTSIIGRTHMLCQMMHTAKDYLTGYLRQLHAAIHRLVRLTTTMVGGGLQYVMNGVTTEPRSYNTFRPSQDGTIQNLTWTESTTIKDMNRATSGSHLTEKTCLIEGKLEICRKRLISLKNNLIYSNKTALVFDLANCGPRNRFTILSNSGPLIVHNCVLGAGYQTGGLKLQVTLKAADPPMEMELDECKQIITTYRTAYPKIPALWKQGDLALQAIESNRTMWYGREGAVWVEGSRGLLLPNGLYIQYPELYRSLDPEKNTVSYSYKDDNSRVGIYGGKITENVVQALARIVVMQQLLRISKKLRVVLTVHDAVAAIAPKEQAEEAQAYVEQCMRWVPKWAAGCPINCESGVGENYGEC